MLKKRGKRRGVFAWGGKGRGMRFGSIGKRAEGVYLIGMKVKKCKIGDSLSSKRRGNSDKED